MKAETRCILIMNCSCTAKLHLETTDPDAVGRERSVFDHEHRVCRKAAATALVRAATPTPPRHARTDGAIFKTDSTIGGLVQPGSAPPFRRRAVPPQDGPQEPR